MADEQLTANSLQTSQGDCERHVGDICVAFGRISQGRAASGMRWRRPPHTGGGRLVARRERGPCAITVTPDGDVTPDGTDTTPPIQPSMTSRRTKGTPRKAREWPDHWSWLSQLYLDRYIICPRLSLRKISFRAH